MKIDIHNWVLKFIIDKYMSTFIGDIHTYKTINDVQQYLSFPYFSFQCYYRHNLELDHP